MRTPAFLPRGFARARLTLLIVALAVPVFAAPDAPAKDYSIFVGQDISVAQQRKYYRVVSVQKNAVQIMEFERTFLVARRGHGVGDSLPDHRPPT